MVYWKTSRSLISASTMPQSRSTTRGDQVQGQAFSPISLTTSSRNEELPSRRCSAKRGLSAYNRAALRFPVPGLLALPIRNRDHAALSVYGGRGIEATSPNVLTGKTAIAKLLSSPNPSGLVLQVFPQRILPFKRHSTTPKLDVVFGRTGRAVAGLVVWRSWSKDDVIYDAEDRDLVVEFKRQITHTEVDCDNIPLLLPAHYRQIDFPVGEDPPVGVNNHIEPKIRFNKSAYKAMLSAVLFDAEAHAEEAPPNPGIQRRFSGLCLLVAGSRRSSFGVLCLVEVLGKNDLGFDGSAASPQDMVSTSRKTALGQQTLRLSTTPEPVLSRTLSATNANAGVPPSCSPSKRRCGPGRLEAEDPLDMAGFTQGFRE